LKPHTSSNQPGLPVCASFFPALCWPAPRLVQPRALFRSVELDARLLKNKTFPEIKKIIFQPQ
jgi:hypothetical protein